MNSENFLPVPQPHEIPVQIRESAMAAYLMMFVSLGAGLPLPFLNLVAAIAYFYFVKKKSSFVHFHALQSLLSQIPVSILNGIAVIWVIRTLILDLGFSQTLIGFLITVGVFNFIYIIFSVIAAVKSYNGRMYYFLFFGKMSYISAFRMQEEREPVAVENQPPTL